MTADEKLVTNMSDCDGMVMTKCCFQLVAVAIAIAVAVTDVFMFLFFPYYHSCLRIPPIFW
jgi:hypothetical protein